MRILFDDVRIGGRAGPAVFDTNSGVIDAAQARADASAPGVLLRELCDSHVHIGLVSVEGIAGSALTRVIDLGWTLEDATAWTQLDAGFEIDVVGRFHTSVAGYPGRQGWAPPAVTRELASVEDVPGAIATALALGARAVKLMLNSDTGTPPADDVVLAFVAAAHDAGLIVVAHAEGEGQAERAFAAGCDVFAHTPWTHALRDDVIVAMAERMTWISTLDIHGWGEYGAEYAVAVDNLRRYHAAGGRVVYGTDMGNGPLPVGLNARELAGLADSGLAVDDIVRSLEGFLPSRSERFVYVPSPVPEHTIDIAAWLDAAISVSPSELADQHS